MRQRTPAAILHTVTQYLRFARTILHAVQRTETKQAREILVVTYFVARKILAVTVLEE